MKKTTGPDALAGKRVWVAGHRGMVGRALVRNLERVDCDLITVGREEVDLSRQRPTEDWIAEAAPDIVFLAAAVVGGIHANSAHPAAFIYDNLAIQCNVIEGARLSGVERLVFLGSSCIYPKLATQPISEEAILTGPLEPTNQWYAMAKLAGIKLCQAYRKDYGCDFISAMPTNLYGPHDNFDLESSHVVPALMRKIHDAKHAGRDSVTIWGTGKPRREFMHVDDCADALVHLACNYSDDLHVNVGWGTDLSICELAKMIAEIIGYAGAFEYDQSKPDGTPRKLLDVSRLNASGWTAGIKLRDGLRQTYAWFLENRESGLRGKAH